LLVQKNIYPKHEEFTQKISALNGAELAVMLKRLSFCNQSKVYLFWSSAGFDKEYMDQLNITWTDKPRGRGPTGTVIRTGKPYVCRNMKIDPNFSPWREQASKRGYTASLVLPLFTFEN
jgi:hypothetical protein